MRMRTNPQRRRDPYSGIIYNCMLHMHIDICTHLAKTERYPSVFIAAENSLDVARNYGG